LMLMAIGGLISKGWIEWISVATYQAASGAGAKHMRELVRQMRSLGEAAGEALENPATSILEIDRLISKRFAAAEFPKSELGVPLAGSLIPWIDRPVEDGQTREEWKGSAETNKLLGLEPPLPVDGVCVRIGAMRSHSQALTLKLTHDIPIEEIESVVGTTNNWVELIPNEKDATIQALSPAAISGTLRIPVGRLRKMKLGPEYVSAFTVGDQLLWGAAEPLRRMLRILIAR